METLVVVGIIGLILTILALALRFKDAEARDLVRIANMHSLQDSLTILKNQTGAYDRAACDLTFVSLCSRVEKSELRKILPVLVDLNDPTAKNLACADRATCESRACNYSFVKLEQTDYEVLFHLERGITGYPAPGCYHLTAAGIEKL